MKRRGAVVIGVDAPEDLAPLESAATSAEEVAAWLGREGFEVECLTDRAEPVTVDSIVEAIKKFVRLPPRYHQLLVYFSGHGFWQARSDRWLLSKAPTVSHEAINLEGAMDLARYSGIPNVVFVSDACRSIPDSRTGSFVDGVDGFPNLADIDSISKVDYFKATSEATAAWEGKIDGRVGSVLTHALLAAYREPSDDMVREIDESGETLEVVPNRRLERYLQDKVNQTLHLIKPGEVQRIDANVPSDDDVYIARVERLAGPGRGGGGAGPGAAPGADRGSVPMLDLTLAVRADATAAIGRSLSTSTPGFAPPADPSTLLAASAETEREMADRMPDLAVDHFESKCGFTVRGAAVESAFCTRGTQGANIEILDYGLDGANPAVLRVWLEDPGVTALARLQDGRGIILPMLAGYIGHATVDDRGLANVSYVPSSNHDRWPAYEQKRAHIDRLRALVAVAVDHGVFRLGSDNEAAVLGDRIRMEKALDPTLGLYAAHAFSQAGED
jgi:hypothetical protein